MHGGWRGTVAGRAVPAMYGKWRGTARRPGGCTEMGEGGVKGQMRHLGHRVYVGLALQQQPHHLQVTALSRRNQGADAILRGGSQGEGHADTLCMSVVWSRRQTAERMMGVKACCLWSRGTRRVDQRPVRVLCGKDAGASCDVRLRGDAPCYCHALERQGSDLRAAQRKAFLLGMHPECGYESG